MESERDRKIRQRAYELWEQGGRLEGRADEHWSTAEAEFAGGSEGEAVGSPGKAGKGGSAASKKVSPGKPAAATPAGKTAAAKGKAAKSEAGAKASSKPKKG